MDWYQASPLLVHTMVTWLSVLMAEDQVVHSFVRSWGPWFQAATRQDTHAQHALLVGVYKK